MNQDEMKKAVALAAVEHVPAGGVIGVGTGSTANFFIDELAKSKQKIDGAVASSKVTAERLKAHGIELVDLNAVDELTVYIDGADECNAQLQLIKGGGGALTREKIVAAVSRVFICIVDETKKVAQLGTFPLPVEVVPMARHHAVRQLAKLGGEPAYREGFVTDNGNIILDVSHMQIHDALKMEQQINNISGVVCNGLFAQRPADVLLMGTPNGVQIFTV